MRIKEDKERNEHKSKTTVEEFQSSGCIRY
jgi:hypothetical protein